MSWRSWLPEVTWTASKNTECRIACPVSDRFYVATARAAQPECLLPGFLLLQQAHRSTKRSDVSKSTQILNIFHRLIVLRNDVLEADCTSVIRYFLQLWLLDFTIFFVEISFRFISHPLDFTKVVLFLWSHVINFTIFRVWFLLLCSAFCSPKFTIYTTWLWVLLSSDRD